MSCFICSLKIYDYTRLTIILSFTVFAFASAKSQVKGNFINTASMKGSVDNIMLPLIKRNIQYIGKKTMLKQPQNLVFKLKAESENIQIGESDKIIAGFNMQTDNAYFIFYVDGENAGGGENQYSINPFFMDQGAHSIRAIARYANRIFSDSIKINVDSVYFDANPADAEAGQTVLLKTRFRGNEDNIRFRFIPGDNSDKTEWLTVPEMIYKYSDAGKFTSYAEIGIIREGTIQLLTKSAVKQINVTSAPVPAAIRLLTDKPVAGTGDTITFFVRSNFDITGREYLFNFGDKSRLQYSALPRTTHVYSHEGNYIASVQLLDPAQNIIADAQLEIIINAAPGVNNEWIQYAVIALFILTVVLILKKYLLIKKPQIRLQQDKGTSLTFKPDNTIINFELSLRQNTVSAEIRIEGTKSIIKSNIIKNERRHNDD